MLEIGWIPEPPLAFGGDGPHLDVRFGLVDYGPIDQDSRPPGRAITIGVVGDSQTIEGFLSWLERCNAGVEGKPTRQPSLFPRFPGLGPDGPFRCAFSAPTACHRILTMKVLRGVYAAETLDKAINAAVELFADQILDLAEANLRPDVVVCALPLEFVQKVTGLVRSEPDEDEPEDVPPSTVNFRGLLKARAMPTRMPIQIVWPTLYDDSAKIRRKLKMSSDRTVEDPASRAWNLFTALYYKANGIPWRLPRAPEELDTCFVGISFFRNEAGDQLHTSSAQLFDERGQGVILRGGRAARRKEDRRPYLPREQARELLAEVLKAYRQQHHNFPARVVLHKTSRFVPDEVEGFDEALAEAHIDFCDMVWLPRKCAVRLMRLGGYPPLRGTWLRLADDEAMLYTIGSTPFYRTYPGLYSPNPLLIRRQRGEASIYDLAREILGLTKLNWNRARFDNAKPITVRASRQVGDVLRYTPDDQSPAQRYSFYM